MPIIRNNSQEATLARLEIASEILERAASNKKFSDAADLSIFNLGVASLNSMLIENKHAEAIAQFINLIRSNGDRHGS